MNEKLVTLQMSKEAIELDLRHKIEQLEEEVACGKEMGESRLEE